MTDSVIDINIVEVKTPDMDATLVAEKHRFSARTPYRFPPRYETVRRPYHAYGCERY